MKRTRVPARRRRAPSHPSRGLARGPLSRYGSVHGCLFISAHVPKAEHDFVLTAFEAHAASGFGRRSSRGLWVSEVETPRGTLILSTDRAKRESFAFYDWET